MVVHTGAVGELSKQLLGAQDGACGEGAQPAALICAQPDLGLQFARRVSLLLPSRGHCVADLLRRIGRWRLIPHPGVGCVPGSLVGDLSVVP